MEYGQLKLDGYIPRIADRQLERMLATFGAVEVAGGDGALVRGGLYCRALGGRFEPQLVQQPLAPLADIICKGGWPALAGRDVASAEYLDAYFDALFSLSIPRRG